METIPIKLSNKFMEDFERKWKAEQPLRDWAYLETIRAFQTKKITTLSGMHKFVYLNDQNCNTIPVETSSILRDDDKMLVKAWLDYDCDTCLCKCFVKDKITGQKHRTSIDLGKKYLSGGISFGY